jgi:hypothetical protein
MKRTSWNLGYLILSAIIAFVLINILFVGCRCWLGSWDRMKMEAGLIVIAIVLFRWMMAWIFKEKNNGWKAYCVILLLSPALIEISFGIASSFLPFDTFHDFNTEVQPVDGGQ